MQRHIQNEGKQQNLNRIDIKLLNEQQQTWISYRIEDSRIGLVNI